jgi:antitoxin CptB
MTGADPKGADVAGSGIAGRGEEAGAQLKRLAMRSWRRGTKEMDLILGPFADAHLAGMDRGALDAYDRLLGESDQDLLPMMLGQRPAPDGLQALVDRIAGFARTRLMS